jgi:hypothetical protein
MSFLQFQPTQFQFQPAQQTTQQTTQQITQQSNPFANIPSFVPTQAVTQQTNPFASIPPFVPTQAVTQQTNPFNFNNLSSYNVSQQFVQDPNMLPLIDKIKNLKLNGVTVYSEKEISGLFGEDVTGIDVCCARGQQIVAIKLTPNTQGSALRTLTHFIYSASVVESKQGPVVKIFVGYLPFDTPTTAALNRNNVKSHVNSNQYTLTTEIAEYIKTLYN